MRDEARTENHGQLKRHRLLLILHTDLDWSKRGAHLRQLEGFARQGTSSWLPRHELPYGFLIILFAYAMDGKPAPSYVSWPDGTIHNSSSGMLIEKNGPDAKVTPHSRNPFLRCLEACDCRGDRSGGACLGIALIKSKLFRPPRSGAHIRRQWKRTSS